MKQYNIQETLNKLNIDYTIIGGHSSHAFSKINTIGEADKNSLVFIGEEREDKLELAKQTKAEIIIVSENLVLEDKSLTEKSLILVKEPRLVITRIAKQLFTKKLKYEIDKTAQISHDASIDDDVYIGFNSKIGSSIIGEKTVIHENCIIDDNVIIGKHVTIHAGCIIGTEAVGHIKNEEGVYENFPQIGGVIIEDGVEIFPNTKVFRGALSNTEIKKNTIIDTDVVVGHNVKVGKNTIITAKTVIGGSTVIGDDVWISLGSVIRDNIKISDRAHIGPGAVVIKDVPEGAKVVSKASLVLPQK